MNSHINNLAVKKALQSSCKFRVSAIGFNKKMECVAKATNISRFPWKSGGMHAERRLMNMAKRKGIKSILICRVGKSGNLRPIDPCPTCAQKAKELNIKLIKLV